MYCASEVRWSSNNGIWFILDFLKQKLVLWAEGFNSVNWLFCEFLRFNTAPLHFLVLLTVLIVAIRFYAFLGSCKRYRVSHIKYVGICKKYMNVTYWEKKGNAVHSSYHVSITWYQRKIVLISSLALNLKYPIFVDFTKLKFPRLPFQRNHVGNLLSIS